VCVWIFHPVSDSGPPQLIVGDVGCWSSPLWSGPVTVKPAALTITCCGTPVNPCTARVADTCRPAAAQIRRTVRDPVVHVKATVHDPRSGKSGTRFVCPQWPHQIASITTN